MNEATARIKTNKLLEGAGWGFFDSNESPAYIRLELTSALQISDMAMSTQVSGLGHGWLQGIG